MATFNHNLPAQVQDLRNRMILAVEDTNITISEDGRVILKSAVIYTGDGNAAFAGVVKLKHEIQLPTNAFVLDDEFPGLCTQCNQVMSREDANEGRICYSCNCDRSRQVKLPILALGCPSRGAA
jgi:hypothetical protein